MSPAGSFDEVWGDFTTIIELGKRLRFVMVECENEHVRERLRQKLKAHCDAEGRPFEAPAPGADPIGWLVERQAASAEAPPPMRDRVQAVGFFPVPTGPDETFTLYRLNENRDNLKRDLRGVLVLAGLTDFLRRVPLDAPDLWSMREKTFVVAARDLPPDDAIATAAGLEWIAERASVAASPERTKRGEPALPRRYDAFLSFAHRDRKAADDLAAALAEAGVRCFLADPSDPVDERALAASRFVVVLLSPDYVATQWDGVERALLAAEDASLAQWLLPLQVRPTVPPPLLRRFNAVQWKTATERERALPELVGVLQGLGRELPRAGLSRTLTIVLRNDGGVLHRTTHGQFGRNELSSQPLDDIGRGYAFGGRHGLPGVLHVAGAAGTLDEHRAGTALVEAGEVLFEALFGAGEAAWRASLAAIAGDSPPSPTRHPVRVRIVADDPMFFDMPWGLTAWHMMPLCDAGWTFEIAPEVHEGADVQMSWPASILLILPDLELVNDPLETASHLDALVELLDAYVDGFSRSPFFRVASTRDEAIHAISTHRPDVVYYYGRASLAGGGLPCFVMRGAGADDVWSAHDAALALRAAGRPPLVVYLNGSWGGPSGFQSIAARWVGTVPAVLAQPARIPSRIAAETAIRWFRRLLSGEEDPIRAAMAQHADGPTGVSATVPLLAFGQFRSFILRFSAPPRGAATTALDLDRSPQRAEALSHVMRLVRGGRERVLGLVVPGTPGNHHGDIAAQLLRAVETQDRRFELNIGRLRRVSTSDQLAPGVSTLNPIDDIEIGLKESLECGPSDPLRHALEMSAPPRMARRVRVLWLDLGVLTEPGVESKLGAWREFCARRLAPACPPDLFIVVILAIEVPQDRIVELRQHLDEVMSQDRSSLFRWRALPTLGAVDLGEVLDFLQDAACPENIRGALAVRMMAATGGAYAELRALLECGLATSWIDLLQSLRTERTP